VHSTWLMCRLAVSNPLPPCSRLHDTDACPRQPWSSRANHVYACIQWLTCNRVQTAAGADSSCCLPYKNTMNDNMNEPRCTTQKEMKVKTEKSKIEFNFSCALTFPKMKACPCTSSSCRRLPHMACIRSCGMVLLENHAQQCGAC
jgi:hypothetical protein